MASDAAARLTPAEGRRFGLKVGGAFVALAGFLWWRGRPAAPILLALGVVLVLAGLRVPATLQPVYRGWMVLGRLLSRIVSPLVMGVLFFGVVTPIGVLLRLVGRNPIPRDTARRGRWLETGSARDPRQRMERQF